MAQGFILKGETIATFAADREMVVEWLKVGDDNQNGTVFESDELDKDGDGRLDGRFLALGDESVFYLQTNAYYRGIIPHLINPTYPDGRFAKKPEYTIDYLEVVETKGQKRIMAYFGSEKDLETYTSRFPKAVPVYVPAHQVEASDATQVHDQIDSAALFVSSREFSHFKWPDQDELNLANRPHAGTSESGYYYRVDVTDDLDIHDRAIALLNELGTNQSSCHNATLIAVGHSDTQKKEWATFVGIGNKKFKKVQDNKPGDIVVLGTYSKTDTQLLFNPYHSYVDLGGGWGFTKNGFDDSAPYRVQRIENIHHLYEFRGLIQNETNGDLKAMRLRYDRK